MKAYSSALIVLWATLAPALARAADGALDTSFAVQGRYAFTAASGNLLSGPAKGVVQNDGKPLMFGATNVASCNTVSAHRLLADGSAHDPGFGSAGITSICLDELFLPGTTVTPLVSDAKPISSGSVIVGNGSGSDGNQFYFLIELDNTGQPIGTFGNAGRVVSNLGATSNQPLQAVAQRAADGVLFAAGRDRGSATGPTLASLRVFGTSGSLLASLSQSSYSSSQFLAVAVQLDGKIVAAGSAIQSGSASQCLVARFIYQSGSLVLDATFNTTGRQLITINGGGTAGSVCTAVAIDSDGTIMLGGNASDSGGGTFLALARLTSSGAVDTSFTGDGYFLGDFDTATGTAVNSVVAIAPMSNGKLVVGGYGTPGPNPPGRGSADFGLLRLTSGNLPDGSFHGTAADSTNGVVTFGFDAYFGTPSTDIPSAMALQNGYIYLIGTSGSTAVVARVVNDTIFSDGLE